MQAAGGILLDGVRQVNPYYQSTVTFRDVTYPGTHDSLVTPETFDQVQTILRQNHVVGDKPRSTTTTSKARSTAPAGSGSCSSGRGTIRASPTTTSLDDHSRKLLHISPHSRVTGPIVVDMFITTMDEYGPPAATLTDNGMVSPPQAGGAPSTRLASGKDGTHAQPNGFEHLLADLHIEQKNGRPNHPTTQEKIERFHQTLKRWLTGDGRVDSLEELATQLLKFRHVYNTQRPHRAIGRRTPDAAYAALPKAGPVIDLDSRIWRIRYDRVDGDGKVSLRFAGCMRHLGIGRAWARKEVLVLVHGNDTMFIDRAAGEIIA
ncbi:integrase-like protein [Brevibacterium sanguinis]|uniref:Integrase-like protein n=2 Tax=Brevibacterium TaxID=1696 RepID=A0A366IHW4_9MICO|nr:MULTISPECIES: integrase core domain-containing protein [Brevibacterium]RBP64266.1 integrase-like protein [Brevibacterium sanguinis]RBP71442.1 integrase-like protein [Brevibacterium celere]